MRAATLAPIALAVVLRLAVVALTASDQQRVFNSDSYEFHGLGRNLLLTGHYSRDSGPPFTPEVEITPLHPSLIRIAYGIFGVRYPVMLVFNVVVAAAITALLLRVGGRWGRPAAYLYALDPTSVVYTAIFNAETTFTFLLLATVVALASALRCADRSQPARIAFAGLIAGLAVLEKPAAMYLPFLLIPAALLMRGRRAGAGALVGLFFLAWALPVAPWLLRNRDVLGITTVSATQEINLLYWNVGMLEAGRLGLDRRSVAGQFQAVIEERTGKAMAELSEGEHLNQARNLAIERIAAHPFAYAAIHARGALLTLFDPGRSDIARLSGAFEPSGLLDALAMGGLGGVATAVLKRPPLTLLPMALTLLWLLMLHSAAAYGLWRFRHRLRGHALGWLGLATLTYLLAVGGPIGNARFRVHLVPYLVFFAAIGMRGGESSEGSAEA